MSIVTNNDFIRSAGVSLQLSEVFRTGGASSVALILDGSSWFVKGKLPLFLPLDLIYSLNVLKSSHSNAENRETHEHQTNLRRPFSGQLTLIGQNRLFNRH